MFKFTIWLAQKIDGLMQVLSILYESVTGNLPFKSKPDKKDGEE